MMMAAAQQGQSGTPDFLLDIVTGASVAYSLRSLKSSTTNVILARRGGDDVESDFTESQIKNGTLTAWASEGSGDGNAYVKTFYEQESGTNHATQTTNSLQAQIVDTGVLNTLNGLPAVYGDGTQYYSFTETLPAAFNDHMTLLVGAHDEFNSTSRCLFGNNEGTTNELQFRKSNANGSVCMSSQRSGVNAPGPSQVFSAGEQFLSLSYYDSVTPSTINRFGGVVATGTTRGTVNDVGGGLLNRDGNGTDIWIGWFQECVNYITDKTADISTIETNANDYYSNF